MINPPYPPASRALRILPRPAEPTATLAQATVAPPTQSVQITPAQRQQEAADRSARARAARFMIPKKRRTPPTSAPSAPARAALAPHAIAQSRGLGTPNGPQLPQRSGNLQTQHAAPATNPGPMAWSAAGLSAHELTIICQENQDLINRTQDLLHRTQDLLNSKSAAATFHHRQPWGETPAGQKNSAGGLANAAVTEHTLPQPQGQSIPNTAQPQAAGDSDIAQIVDGLLEDVDSNSLLRWDLLFNSVLSGASLFDESHEEGHVKSGTASDTAVSRSKTARFATQPGHKRTAVQAQMSDGSASGHKTARTGAHGTAHPAAAILPAQSNLMAITAQEKADCVSPSIPPEEVASKTTKEIECHLKMIKNNSSIEIKEIPGETSDQTLMRYMKAAHAQALNAFDKEFIKAAPKDYFNCLIFSLAAKSLIGTINDSEVDPIKYYCFDQPFKEFFANNFCDMIKPNESCKKAIFRVVKNVSTHKRILRVYEALGADVFVFNQENCKNERAVQNNNTRIATLVNLLSSNNNTNSTSENKAGSALRLSLELLSEYKDVLMSDIKKKWQSENKLFGKEVSFSSNTYKTLRSFLILKGYKVA
jgi:hypothetical protein